MTDLDRLRVLFDELGDYQRAVDGGVPLAEVKAQMLARLSEAELLLPPGNQHIWTDFRWWIMHGWADAHHVGYLAWTWDTWDCSSGPALITSYDGTPTAFGAAVRAHFLAR